RTTERGQDMRLRTRVCAASAALALTALPFATTSALTDGTGDAAESTDVAPTDDEPASATVDGPLAPEATTTLTTPSDTPEDVASPEDDEPSEQDEDSKSPAEDAPDDVPNDPEAPEEPEQPPEEPEASEDTTVGGPTISRPHASATESGTPTNTGGTDDPTVTPTDDPDRNDSTETETDPEDSATCDGGAGDNTEGGASTEEPARTVKGALVPRLIAQQRAATTTQKPQSPAASPDAEGGATDCPCNCPTQSEGEESDDSTDDEESPTPRETPTGEDTTGGGSGETTDDEKTTPAPDQGATPTASPSATPEMSEPSTPAQPDPEP